MKYDRNYLKIKKKFIDRITIVHMGRQKFVYFTIFFLAFQISGFANSGKVYDVYL